ncbi:MAG: ABC transporter permease [Acidobacteria bacterium]|nr:ABC transporter permease [Acidobacteriota bacterium]
MSESPWSRIGWRNVGRHPRRTILTALGLAVGYGAVVFMIGWANGLIAEMVENATGLMSGQIEIHDAEYRPERSIYDTIGGRDGVDFAALMDRIAEDERTVGVAPRVFAAGLVSSGEATTAGQLMGIDPERETGVTRFLEGLAEGRLPEPGRNEMAIGSEMARQLESGVGDELVVVAPGADGSMGNDLYTVSGIYTTGLVELDATNAVLPLPDLQALVMLDPARIHEIVVATTDPFLADEMATGVAASLGAADLGMEVVSWSELNPTILEFSTLMDSFYWIIYLFVFGIAIFGVANTMLMATYERRREIAVMLAMGAVPGAIVKSILYEAAAMGLLSLVIGVAISLPPMLWWYAAPADLSWLYGDMTLQGVLLRPVMRVTLEPASWVGAAVALFATALLAALYPAWRASRVPPADTLSGI